MNDLNNYQYFLVVDLEATCCNLNTISRQEMEIIEIGAVMVEANNLTVIDKFQTFIKPVRHPILTDFCQQLTSITQAQVTNAPNYPEAIDKFKKWLYQYPNFIFGSWGDYDRQQFRQDCDYHRVSYPLGSQHINLKKLFSTNQGLKKRYGMAQALKLADLELQGTHHRGIDDAQNIAKLMPFILGKKKINIEKIQEK
jgi:inhibitor of KinA sporulation pathway (predicted exonuclease)